MIMRMTKMKEKERKNKKKAKSLSITKEDLWAPQKFLSRRKGKSECEIQEEHRGQHESIRLQSEDHAGSGSLRLKMRGPTWKMRTLRVTYFLLKRTRQWTSLLRLSNTRPVAKTK